MKTFLFLLLSIFSLKSFSQEKPLSIKDWKTYPIPTNRDSLSKYNRAWDEWTVSLKDNNIYAANRIIYKSDPLPFEIIRDKHYPSKYGGNRSVVKMQNGFIVGFYYGEFGGGLYWFSTDGKKQYEISKDLIKQFIFRNNKLYALKGLQHDCSIVEISFDGEKWGMKDYLKLSSPGMYITNDPKNNFVVVTLKELLRVDEKASVTYLIKNAFWVSLCPTSIVIKDDSLYIGMRKGIFKYGLTTKKQEWLLPK